MAKPSCLLGKVKFALATVKFAATIFLNRLWFTPRLYQVAPRTPQVESEKPPKLHQSN
jgi:hypothetical protein